MNGQEDTQLIATAAATLPTGSGLVMANRLAEAIKKRWRRGEQPDMNAVLAEHPDLRRYRSVVLDLACEEYQHRMSHGESLDAEEFSGRFPSMQKSLYLLLEVQRLLDHDPQFGLEPESIPWPELGGNFLGFGLLAELGRGTFGRVFLASEPALGNRLVALKVAPHGGGEAEIVGKLRHANVVPIYSIQEDPETGLTAVCMPYLGRSTLCDVLDYAFANGPPPTRASVILEVIQDLVEADDLKETQSVDRFLARGTYVDGVLHLAAQLADALAYTHARGICHRDLKPSNVLLTLEGRPLLLDFNLSFDPNQNAKRVGGTLPYMAPEQLRQVLAEASREPEPADPRSDIFSLGVILYELLCGRHPFGDIAWNRPLEQVAASLLERQEQGPEPVALRNRDVDKSLDRLVGQCLAFDPAARPQSAADLAAALRRELAPMPRARRWSRRHPIWTACLGVLFLLVLLGGMAAMALRDPANVRQFKRGKAALEQEKYATALEALGEAIRLDPSDLEARVTRARTYQQMEMWDKAIYELQAIDEIAPTGKIMAAIGYCLHRPRQPIEAESYYEIALRRGYRSADVLNNLAFCFASRGRWQDAEKLLKEAAKKDPNLRAAHFNLILTYFNSVGNLRPNFHTAGNLRPNFGMGSARRALQPCWIPKEAYLHARKAVELGPPSREAYALAGSLMFRAEDVARRYSVQKLPDLSTRPDESERRLGLEYLKQAIAHGANPLGIPILGRIPESASLAEQKLWKELTSMSPGHKPSIRCATTVNPLEYRTPASTAVASSHSGTTGRPSATR